MANLPRLLPIVFVAVAGVLAMKAITSLDLLPGVFHAAEAFAADKAGGKADGKAGEKPKKTAKKAGDEVAKSDDPTESYAVDPALKAADATSAATNAVAAVPAGGVPKAPICATSVSELAQQAGISPNELNILQSLGARRVELDQREAQLDSRAQLIQAADDKLDARITQLQNLKGQVQALIDQANKTSETDTVRMVKVYEAMKPKDAAAVLTAMSDDVRLPIVAGMKDRSLAAILGAMAPDAARELTEKLSNRMKAADGLQQRLDKATASGGVAATTPAAGGAPAKPAPAAKAPAKAKG